MEAAVQIKEEIVERIRRLRPEAARVAAGARTVRLPNFSSRNRLTTPRRSQDTGGFTKRNCYSSSTIGNYDVP